MLKGESVPVWSTAGQGDWRSASELLAAGQYERVAQLLSEAQAVQERAGNGGSAQLLAAARGICLACSQVRAEGEWHRQAQQEAGQREGELRQQLLAILDLVNRCVPMAQLSLSEPGAPPSPRRPSLKQRIQGLFSERPGPWPIKLRAHLSSAQVPSLPSAKLTETPMALPIVKEERQVSPALVVYCLGPFRVYQDDQPVIVWPSGKGKCVFKYMVANRGHSIPKDVLMDLFWPDADPEAGRRNLHQAIYSLRQTLRREQPELQHIQFENDCYSLNSELNIWLDFQEFEKHVQSGRRLEAAGRYAEAMAEYGIAEVCYQGDFLEEDLYEDWPSLQRERIRTEYLDIVDRLSEYYVQQGEHAAAITLCQKVLARDNCHEGAHRRLMQCYLAQGQRHLAVRQYQTCVKALKEGLDLAPSEESAALYREIIAAA